MTQLSDRVVSHIDGVLRHLTAVTDAWKTYRRDVQISGDHAPASQGALTAVHIASHAAINKEIEEIGSITTTMQEAQAP